MAKIKNTNSFTSKKHERELIPGNKTDNNLAKSRIIDRKFGRDEDIIETHIYPLKGNSPISSNYNFTEYTFPHHLTDSLSSEINLDPQGILNKEGLTSGKYRLIVNIHRNKIYNTESSPFKIIEISPSRSEIRVIAPDKSNNSVNRSVGGFISEMGTSVFFKEFIISFKKDIHLVGINIALNKLGDKTEILIKLSNPLPSNIKKGSVFNIREEITHPIQLDVDLGAPKIRDTSIPLQGPNFKIDIRLNNSVPSGFKNYDEILEYSLTSSYNNLLSQLENREIPEISYDYIRPVSESSEEIPTHFENFVHFSSATERLRNFEYKLKLIELYDDQIKDIGNITGPTSESVSVLNNKESINSKRSKLIVGLDGYEQYLYYTSGTYAWPKTNNTKPYTLYSVTSSEAKTWLGDDRDTFPLYGGQLLSASIFDRQNDHSLSNLTPKHITDNTDNDFYKTFCNMVGQHFDQIWTHIHHLTEINDSHHTKGISKDLVYYQLKSLGLDTFDQFENSNLIEYILGEGSTGSVFYDTPVSQSYITASNAGSIPKGDITKAIWKRLYHNAPYLLKTKGTERGLKALMSCYGVPSTLLNVKEYGGSTSDKTTYKTFSYEKGSLALSGSAGASEYLIRADWAAHARANDDRNKAITLRIKPERTTNYDVIALSLGDTITDVGGFQLHLEASSSGIDVHEVGDNTLYGRLNVKQNGASREVSPYFPLYNGEFWNIYLQEDKGNGIELQFGALQANHLKNIHHIKGGGWGGSPFNTSWGKNASQGSTYLFAGAYHYTGAIQELRTYWGETLSDSTLKKQALEPFMYAGNTISSSYENLVARYPLGSNDQENFNSHTPNENITARSSTAGVTNTTYIWEEVIETHHLPSPDTVGASMTSEKVRIDTGTINDDILSSTIKSENSTLDRQPQDFEDLGVFFSPTTEINEDIIYTLGAFRLDDYIGSPLPSTQTADNYSDLKDIRDVYFKKVDRKYNYWDYIKLIQQIDHTLFKLIEQWVPMKANLKTGLLIEPHYLERNKFAREVPVIDYGQTMTQGSYSTLDFQIDPERQFTLDGSAVITTNNLSKDERIQSTLSTTFNPLPSPATETNNPSILFESTNGDIVYYQITSSLDYKNSPGPGNVTTLNSHPVVYFYAASGDLPSGPTGSMEQLSSAISYQNQNISTVNDGVNILTLTQNAGGPKGDTHVAQVYVLTGTIQNPSIFQFSGGKNNPKKEIGTNVTIDIDDYILDEQQEATQAPIQPYTTTKPEGYKKYTSNTLLGNATKGKLSTNYYRSLDKGKELDY